ncbi:tetratricopeptide repeat protein [Patescibacteria group bacterium]|nr:tetratricopeptide repeat protein [Patescibacteria group bacterium]
MWIFIVVYLAIGVVSVLRDLSQPIINRPLYLGRRETRLTGMISKVLLWPISLRLPRNRSHSEKGTSHRIEVNASEEVVDLYNQGTIASSKGQYERAIELFTQALDQDPEFVPAYMNRGNAYNKLSAPIADTRLSGEQLDKAISDYSKATQIDPTNGQAFYYRAWAKYIKGSYRESLLDLQHARSLGYADIDYNLEQTVMRFVEKNL